MNKFYSDVTLLNQSYILDPDKTVKSVLEDYKTDYNYDIISFNFISL